MAAAPLSKRPRALRTALGTAVLTAPLLAGALLAGVLAPLPARGESGAVIVMYHRFGEGRIPWRGCRTLPAPVGPQDSKIF